MNFSIRRGFEIAERDLTPESVYFSRRKMLQGLGLTAGALLAGCDPRQLPTAPTDDDWTPIHLPGNNPNADLYPARRSGRYPLDRPITRERETATWNNYYEFTPNKNVWERVEGFVARPWEIEVGGLVNRPLRTTVDELVREFGLEERTYRHRCVEAWAMAVPWTGFPLSELLRKAAPTSRATHVRFVSFDDPSLPGVQSQSHYPWPYFEGLTLGEAMNELAFVATGVYGHELPLQNGAPWRVIVPWKYGYKGPKGIQRIELVDFRPETFWNTAVPSEYGFFSNVNPEAPHPRWSQATETLIDTGEERPTQVYNGYGEYVAALYPNGPGAGNE